MLVRAISERHAHRSGAQMAAKTNGANSRSGNSKQSERKRGKQKRQSERGERERERRGERGRESESSALFTIRLARSVHARPFPPRTPELLAETVVLPGVAHRIPDLLSDS